MRTTKFIIFLTLLLLSFTFLFTEGFAAKKTAKKAEFTDTILTTSESHLILFSILENSFTDEMIQGVKSGIPIQFSFFIVLDSVANNWPDKEIVSMQFQHTLTYDTLKENYIVELEESGHRLSQSKFLAETQKNMGEINGLEIIPLKDLIANGTYRLKIRAELYKKTLPMGLHKVTPFISWWDVETDWHEVEFKY